VLDTQRERRGHDFLPPPEILAKIPREGRTGHQKAADITIWVHYYCAVADWWVAELEHDEEDVDHPWRAYGYARYASYPDGAEWGTVWLDELERHNSHGGLVIVERDVLWTPRPFGEMQAPA
jgi:hypothetical protein